jgi:hypothetical protein
MAQPTRPDAPQQPETEPNPVLLIKIVAWLFIGPMIFGAMIWWIAHNFEWTGILGAAAVIALVAGVFVYRLKRPSKRVRPWSSGDGPTAGTRSS